MEIVPSLAAANQAWLGEEARRLEQAARIIHLDVEDGNFTPNVTFGLKTIRDLRRVTQLPFSVHLMVSNPEDYVAPMAEVPLVTVTFHVEACQYPSRVVNTLRQLNVPVGVALCPKTQVQDIEYVLDSLDLVLIMTAEEDCESQRFIPRMLEKVRVLSARKAKGQQIWVDGGVREEHLFEIWKSGADAVVMGRSLFHADDLVRKIREVRNMIRTFSQRGDGNAVGISP